MAQHAEGHIFFRPFHGREADKASHFEHIEAAVIALIAKLLVELFVDSLLRKLECHGLDAFLDAYPGPLM